MARPSYIGVKLNSLTDKDIIEKLIDASEAGVKIELIIRGICCLVPAVPEMTENITVISVVGRFLEHSRIYRFGVGEEEKVYISSADFMTRNTLRRVEVAVPIYDLAIKSRFATSLIRFWRTTPRERCRPEIENTLTGCSARKSWMRRKYCMRKRIGRSIAKNRKKRRKPNDSTGSSDFTQLCQHQTA